MKNILTIVVAPMLMVLVLSATDAHAQAAEPPAAPAPAAGQATEPPKGYESPMRMQCEAELRKDAGWYATLGKQVRAGVHAEDAKLFTTNRKHVIMAYAALWVITVAFVVFIWLRQGALRAEILRLQRDLDRAVGETDDKGKKA